MYLANAFQTRSRSAAAAQRTAFSICDFLPSFLVSSPHFHRREEPAMPVIGRVAVRTWRRIAFMFAGTLLMLDVGAASAQTGVVVGRVTDARFSEAIAGAAIEIEGTRLS